MVRCATLASVVHPDVGSGTVIIDCNREEINIKIQMLGISLRSNAMLHGSPIPQTQQGTTNVIQGSEIDVGERTTRACML